MAWLLDKLFGADDLQSEGDALDAELRRVNERDYSEGGRIYNIIEQSSGQAAADGAYQTVLDNLTSGATGNVSQQLEQEFDLGWEEGKQNVTGAVSKAFSVVTDIAGTVLKGVPWWIWALVILYFAWPILAPMIARRAATQ